MPPEFERLLLAVLPHLRAYARSLTRHPDQADDLVHATLLRLIQSHGQHHPGTSFKAWANEISYEDAAKVLGCPIGTVRSRLARARAVLQTALEKQQDNGQKSPTVTSRRKRPKLKSNDIPEFLTTEM